MTYTTGNSERDEYLTNAVRFLERTKREPTRDAVSAWLDAIAKSEGREPFDLLQRELDGVLGNFHPADAMTFDDSDEHTGEVPFNPASGGPIAHPIRQRAPEALKNLASLRANEAAPSSDIAPEATPEATAPLIFPTPEALQAAGITPRPAREVTRDDAMRALNAAQADLADARIVVRQRVAELQAARGKLAEAIQQWQLNTPHLSPEQNARNYAMGALEERKRRAALYGSGTSATANAFARRQRMVPPGTDPALLVKGRSRGAHPASERMLRGPRRPDPPMPEVVAKMGVAPKA
jgi:hypothetical protein